MVKILIIAGITYQVIKLLGGTDKMKEER